jgi:hypothetical protein
MTLHGEPVPGSLVELKGRRKPIQEKCVDGDMSHAAFVRYDADTVDPDPLVVSHDGVTRLVVG